MGKHFLFQKSLNGFSWTWWGTHRHCAYRSSVPSDEEITSQWRLGCVVAVTAEWGTRLCFPSRPGHTRGYIPQAFLQLWGHVTEFWPMKSGYLTYSDILALKTHTVLCALSLFLAGCRYTRKDYKTQGPPFFQVWSTSELARNTDAPGPTRSETSF